VPGRSARPRDGARRQVAAGRTASISQRGAGPPRARGGRRSGRAERICRQRQPPRTIVHLCTTRGTP